MSRTHRSHGAVPRRAFRLGMEQLEDRAVPASVDVAVDKTTLSDDISGNVYANDQIVYQVVVSNNGPGAATGVTFTDNLPDTLTNISWTSTVSGTASGNTDGNLASGTSDLTNTLTLGANSSVTYTITATLPSTASSVTNTATATVNSSVDTDTNAANNTDSVTNAILAPTTDVGVTKTDSLDTVAAGQTVTYTVVVRNNGTTAVSSATFTDTLPSNLTNVSYTSSVTGGATGNLGGGGTPVTVSGTSFSNTLSLPAGSTVTYLITGTVNPSATVSSSVANTATVSGVTGDEIAGNNTAIDTDTVAAANVGVTKTDNRVTVAPGETITYTIVVSNPGGADLTDVSFTDDLPSTLTGVTWTSQVTSGTASGNTASGSGDIDETLDLQSGAVVTYTVTGTVAAGTAAGTVISNTANVAAPTGVTDSNTANNSASASATVSTVDLQVTKTDNVTTVAPGQSITYTITVSNAAGNASVTGATLTDTFPAGLDATTISWTSTVTGGASGNQTSGTGNINDTGLNLPAGSTITYRVTALVADTTVAGTLQNTATVTATGDTNTGNNTATDTDAVAIPTGPVNLAITKTDDDNSKFAVRGQPLTYTITVSNIGSNTAAGAQVQDILSSEFDASSATWTSVYSNGATGSSGTGNISDTITLAAGQSITYSLEATVLPSARGGLENTATVTPALGITDTNPANNSATDRNTVLPKFVPAYFNQFAVGSDAGASGHVKVFAPDGSLRFSFLAFPGFNGGIRVASGDVNNDGVNDIIVGGGFGAPGGHVKVFDGETGGLLASFLSFPGFNGGVDVAVGDVDNDGFGDIIVGAGFGGGHVKAFSLATGAPVLLASYIAYPGSIGGVTVATGDVNGDNVADIITGTARGPAHVKAFTLVGSTPVLLASFITLPGYTGGIDVAAGNIRGDARDEFIIAPLSAGAGGAVQVFSIDSTSPIATLAPDFPGRDTGLRVGVADADGDGDLDILVATGPGRGARVKAYDGASFTLIDDFDAFVGFQGGVFVG